MKRVMITGANRGLGLAFTQEFLQSGDHVLAVFRPNADPTDLEKLQTQYPNQLTFFPSMLNSADNISTLYTYVYHQFEAFDLLINNAGSMTPGETIDNVQLQNLLSSYHINAVIPLLLVQQMLPLLREGDGAAVVNISSSFASLGLKSDKMPPRYSYSMSKAALNMFTKTLAFELAEDNIMVVAIHPGWVRTAIGGPDANFLAKESAEAVVKTIKSLTPEQSGTFITWDARELPW